MLSKSPVPSKSGGQSSQALELLVLQDEWVELSGCPSLFEHATSSSFQVKVMKLKPASRWVISVRRCVLTSRHGGNRQDVWSGDVVPMGVDAVDHSDL